eukprot:Rhum_TRINITY_DN2434_c0_g1::Rhum_TRINITY_DN2434_c0_g1_i1::g.7224::m.7224/K21343/USP15; ubiquitin carboxyl-terminal hydrolase 15
MNVQRHYDPFGGTAAAAPPKETNELSPTTSDRVPSHNFAALRLTNVNYRVDRNEIQEATPYSCALPAHLYFDREVCKSLPLSEAEWLPRYCDKVRRVREYVAPPPPPPARQSDSASDDSEHSPLSAASQRTLPLDDAYSVESGCETAAHAMQRFQKNNGGFVQGCVGLMNVGNTCFMSAVLQCLSHTAELREYYLSERFAHHINLDNPVGRNGEVAYAFHQLLRLMWHTGSSQRDYFIRGFAPVAFKRALTSFFHTYSTNQQQDAHEFLTFLLDGLHEDCNRVVKKPYVAAEDSDDDEDADAEAALATLRSRAAVALQGHVARNKSLVYDLFDFQLKSTTSCDTCKHKSTRFEAVSCVQLPVLNEAMEYLIVHVKYVPMDHTLPETHYRLRVKKHGTVAQITRDLRKLLGEPDQEEKSYSLYEYCMETGSRAALSDEEILSHRFADTLAMSSSPNYARFRSTSPMKRAGPDAMDTVLPVVNVYEHVSVPRNPVPKCNNPPEENTTLLLEVAHHVTIMKPQRDTAAAAAAAVRAGVAPLTEFDDEYDDDDDSETSSEFSLSDERYGKEYDEEELVVGADRVRHLFSHTSFVRLTRDSIGDELLQALAAEAKLRWGGDESDDDADAVQPVLEAIQGPAPRTSRRVSFDLTSLPLKGMFYSACERQFSRATGKRVESDILSHKTVHIDVVWRGTRAASRRFVMLRPPLRPDPVIHPSVAQETLGKDSRCRVVSLESCFDLHNKTEQLDMTNSWYCSKCKKQQCAYRSTALFSLPQYLVVHLKKNHLTPYGVWRKVDMAVTYPLKSLDLKPYVDEAAVDTVGETVYDLYAAVCHYGSDTMGHCTAIVYSQEAQAWMSCDDEHVAPISEKEAAAMPIHLLFYKRRNTNTLDS